VGRRRHTFDRPRESLRVVVRHVQAVQSTIQREIGIAVVKIGFAIGRKSEHARRQHVVLLLTLYVLSGADSKAQLALFVSVKVAVRHSVERVFLSLNLEQTRRLLRLAPLMHCI